MDNITQPVSSANSSETINDFSEHKASFGDSSDQQKSPVKQKESELKEMQDQIESYNQMVKQLASQREMAVKKLADMDTQIKELTNILETERLQVEAKDKELKTKRTQLQTLKNEESELKEKFTNFKEDLSSATENLSNTRIHEKQVETKLRELQQFLVVTNAAIDDIEKAVSIKDTIKLSALCNQMLTPPPLSVNNLLTNGTKTIQAPVTGQRTDSQDQEQPQHGTDNHDSIFDSSANFDPFAGEDPFDGDDPFKSEDPNLVLPEDDPFNPSSAATGLPTFDLAQNDPFASPSTNRGGF